MPDPESLLIRADAGGSLGTGHVMRMIALAQAWQDQGGDVTLASCDCPEPITRRLNDEGIRSCAIGAERGGHEDLERTIRTARELSAQWVVLDGYHFDGEFQLGLRQAGFRVLAVDDYGHCCNWRADMVLNPNLHAAGLRTSLEADHPDVTFLLGPQYALLRREFLRNAGRDGSLPDGRRKLLVTFGGVDPTGATVKIVDALDAWQLDDFDVRVIVGGACPHLDQLRMLVRAAKRPMELWVDVKDMPEQYQWATAIISAGGSSCHEWLLFNRPAWVVSVADNQDPVLAALKEQDLATTAGRIEDFSGPEALASSLRAWFHSPIKTKSGVVDGWGATRVVTLIAGAACFVRPVREEERELRFLHALANDPVVRAAGYHTAPIAWETHVDWVHRHLRAEGSRLLLIEHPTRGPAGLVRFHRCENGAWEVGISVDSSSRGAGIARTALLQGMARLNQEFGRLHWTAIIRPENQASQRLFRSLGFQLERESQDQGVWTLIS